MKWNNLIFHHVNIYFNFYTHRHLLFVYINYYMHWSQHNFFMWMLQSCICILQEMAFCVQIYFVFILFRWLISFIKIIILDFRLKTTSFIVCFTWSFQNNRKLEGALDNFSFIPDFFFKKVEIFISLEVHAYVLTPCLILLELQLNYKNIWIFLAVAIFKSRWLLKFGTIHHS